MRRHACASEIYVHCVVCLDASKSCIRVRVLCVRNAVAHHLPISHHSHAFTPSRRLAHTLYMHTYIHKYMHTYTHTYTLYVAGSVSVGCVRLVNVM